ncbi:uncharacterized protein LOC125499918 [Athalia rosae]|uniref:uncharacterized protein LOC125499918 n=1 Tax=Athalia rosae TaxID=37344 RepID=UPI00203411E1|nr:uncharacterized protein LOC125499918 [Athalia rosae]
MSNYFKERMGAIQLQNDQITQRRTLETEIHSLEENLKSIESQNESLRATYESYLEKFAFIRVDLEVSKETYEFTKTVLEKRRAILVEEKKKLDELHWKVWEEQSRSCDEVRKCVAANNSVEFLNEYPRILDKGRYRFMAAQESDEDVEKAVAEHPEAKRLADEMAVLDLEIEKLDSENSCLAEKLQKISMELDKLNSDDFSNSEEIQRLIEALESSHRDRMALEAEIKEIEDQISQADDRPFLKVEYPVKIDKETGRISCPKETFIKPESDVIIGELTEENPAAIEIETAATRDDSKVLKKEIQKLKAKKWYEEYMRSLPPTEDQNEIESKPNLSNIVGSNVSRKGDTTETKNPEQNCGFFSSQNKEFLELHNPPEFFCEEDDDRSVSDCPKVARRRCPPRSAKKLNKSPRLSQSVKSRFFEKKKKNVVATGLEKEDRTPKIEVTSDRKLQLLETPAPKRNFMPIVATPGSFFIPQHETANDGGVVQRNYCEKKSGPSTFAVNDVRPVEKKKVRFTPKRPSNIEQKAGYRQTKLDDFHSFMLPDYRPNMY